MLHIDRVETSYNGTGSDGKPRVYELSQRTVVVGPTGSGKTTLLASLGLLLTSHADDAVGRAQVAAGADLALAMAEDQSEISVTGRVSDGTTLQWGLAKGKRAASWPGASDWRHPVRRLREILAQGPDAARRDMAPLLLGSDVVELHRVLPRRLHDMVPATVSLDGLVDKIEAVAKDLRAAEKARELLESNVETLEQTLPPRPNDDQLAALRALVAEFRTKQEAHLRAKLAREHAAQRYAACQRRLEALSQRANALIEERAAIPAAEAQFAVQEAQHRAAATGSSPEPEPTPPFTEEQVGNLTAYERVLSLARPGFCPLCSTPADVPTLTARVRVHLDKQVAYQQQRLLWAERQRTALTSLPAPTRNFRTFAEIDAEYEVLRAEYHHVANEAQSLVLSIAEVDEAGSEDLGEDPTSLLASAEQAATSHTFVVAKRGELLAAQDRVASLRTLTDELRRIMDVAFRERSAAAVEGVSRWLPKGHRMELLLTSSSGTRVFRLGLRTPEGRVEMNPSGGKRMALLLALAVWLIDQGRIPVSNGPVVVMPAEERAFSPRWLGQVMAALADAPVQLVICNLVKPVYRGKTWTVIELPGEEEEAPAKRGKKKTAGADGDGGDNAGTTTLSWEDVKDNPGLRKEFSRAIPQAEAEFGPTAAEKNLRFLRTPTGQINNCARAVGGPPSSCQICGGDCPDDEAYDSQFAEAK